ncbi:MULTISPECIES: helix-turn-helix domain-containing protein [unclassified Pseudonocardia]|uniref:helix-turn-helix domain-containing protein n=1 Tax=unclassified Pseudonocardia TaxID=2619320 RepID=UPI000A651697|nr:MULTISPECIES: helix-turn-helix domain-containing protein [unclassified Pseudonocardia]
MVAATEPGVRWQRPAPAVRPWVATYTGYRMEAGPPGVHIGVPSPHLTFLLCLDGAIQMVGDTPGRFGAMVAGLHDVPDRIAQGEAQTGIQLRLTWRGARALFGTRAGDLAADIVDLDALPGRCAAPLLDRLACAPTWPERFAVLDAELTALAARGRGDRGVRPEVGYAWDRLEETGGNLRIADLAAEVGWSRRHLAEHFRAETGLAPKAAARVMRFERACDRLRSPARPSLAAVAADGGYVDQAHLSRDFRDLAGQTATAWLADRPTP